MTFRFGKEQNQQRLLRYITCQCIYLCTFWNIVPPGRHKFPITFQDSLEHRLITTFIVERLKATQSAKQELPQNVSRQSTQITLVPEVFFRCDLLNLLMNFISLVKSVTSNSILANRSEFKCGKGNGWCAGNPFCFHA